MVPSRTPTLAPTNTPFPIPDLNVQYRLVDWTPERAEALIDKMILYPNGLEGLGRGYLDSGYVWAFGYAGMVEAEAMLRFPADPMAIQWRWDNAYHRALNYDQDVDQVYGNLVTDGLNHGETDLPGLQTWFEEHEPRLKLEVTPLSALPGYETSLILLIYASQESITSGGVFVLLVKDHSGYRAYPVRDFQQFEPAREDWELHLADLTGDGVPEAITEYSDRLAGFDNNYLEVFDLGQIPPRKLSFEPGFDTGDLELAPGWTTESGKIEFQWLSPYSPVGRQAEYRWNGQVLKETSARVYLRDEAPSDVVYTDTLTTHMLYEVESGDMLFLEPLKSMLDTYPLGTHPLPLPFYEAIPYPPDARDELRFRLGIALAFHNDAAGAIQQMQTIVNTPVVITSTWITPAQQFLDIYHRSKDLPAACLAIGQCSSSLYLPDLLSILPPTSLISPLGLLRANGWNFPASGSFDFDQDGVPEYWAISTSEYNSELEIIYAIESQYETTSFGDDTPITDTASITFTFTTLPPLEGAWVYSLEAQSTNFLFVFSRTPGGGVQVIELTDQLDAILQECEQALLSGADPTLVLDRLGRLVHETYWACDERYYPWSCLKDRYLYLYGLAQELIGDREGAAATYLELWQSFPYSPYAFMAQAKLEPVP